MEEKDNIKNLLITIFIIVAILVIFYFITIFITSNKKEKTNHQSNNEAVIDYDTILASDIYKQNKSSYYVLVSMPEDEKVASYQSTLTTYSEKEDALHVYQVDLGIAFNKNYISDNTDLTGKFPVFSATTLLKIENGSIIESYQGEDITTILQVLASEE